MFQNLLMGLLLITTTQVFGREPLPESEIAAIINEFDYPLNYEMQSDKKSGGIFDRCWEYDRVITTEYPQMEGGPLEVTLRMYIPNRDRLGEERVPTVFMLPPIGGMSILDKQQASSFCSENVAAIIIANDFANIQYQANEELLPPEDHQKTFYRSVAGVKAAMAMVADDENIDSKKMGLFGISLGGILASFIMETQPDISAGYFMVAGGDIPNILAYSQQQEVSTIREKRMEEQGFQTEVEYEHFLRTHITFDPVDIARTMIPDTLTMVIAKKDTRVPTPNQFLLHRVFGEPETIEYNAEHLDTILQHLFWGSNRQDIAEFFLDQFSRDNPRPAAFDFMSQFELNYYW